MRKIPNFKITLCRQKKHRDKNGIFQFEVKGDDVHLAIDLVSNAYENQYDTAIIISGDEDFVPALRKVQQLGKAVENAYFIGSSSSALKNTANKSICLNELIKELV